MRRSLSFIMAVFIALNAVAFVSCRTVTDPSSESTQAKTRQIEKITPPAKGCDIDFPDSEVYDYKMDLKFDPDAKSIGGHVVFSFFNDSEDPWKELCLRDYPTLFDEDQAYGLGRNGAETRIEKLTDSRSGSLEYRRDEDDASVIWIDLDKELKPGEHMTLSYDLLTVIPKNADRFGVYKDVYNITNFYPILAEYKDGSWSHAGYFSVGECFYSEISNYHVTLEVPEGFLVASTGEETSSEAKGRITTLTYEAPFVRDFVFSISSLFEKESRDCGGVNVNIYYNSEHKPEQDMTKVINKSFDTAKTSLEAFGEAFGKYPYKELDVVLSEIDAGGMEYPNLVIISSEVCHDDVMEYEAYDQLENTLAHEIGHQWFMGIVGSNSGVEPWLDESVTSYSEIVFYEYIGGKTEENHTEHLSRDYYDLAKIVRNQDNPGVSSGEYDIMGYIDRAYDEFSGDNQYIGTIYETGKMTLYQMEQASGREEFHAFLRAYVNKFKFKNASTEDFMAVLYGCLGRDNEKLNRILDAMFITKI